MSLPFVYVVFLTYNRIEDTLQALDSFFETHYTNYRILIVDNASTDGTVDLVQERYPQVEVLLNNENLGFAAGANVGLRYALENDADFVLLINNDVVVDPEMLSRLIQATDQKVGAVAPIIYRMEAPRAIWSAGFVKHPILLERRRVPNQAMLISNEKPFEVDYLVGCAMLLSASVLQEVGLLNPQYFFYYEDLDLCLRLQDLGYHLLVVPDARMWHKGSASAGEESAFRIYQMARSSVVFFFSHTYSWQRIVTLIFRFGSTLKRSLQWLLRREFFMLVAHWNGLWRGWRERHGGVIAREVLIPTPTSEEKIS